MIKYMPKEHSREHCTHGSMFGPIGMHNVRERQKVRKEGRCLRCRALRYDYRGKDDR